MIMSHIFNVFTYASWFWENLGFTISLTIYLMLRGLTFSFAIWIGCIHSPHKILRFTNTNMKFPLRVKLQILGQMAWIYFTKQKTISDGINTNCKIILTITLIPKENDLYFSWKSYKKN